MKLYFMRHGESLANEKDILASRQDYALSERGQKDVALIARQFAERIGTLDGIITSPLTRAEETAAPFCDILGIEPETDEAVIEQELGVFAGMTYAQVEACEDYETDRTKRWEWVPRGGGESYAMIAERIKPFFARMEERASSVSAAGRPDESLLVVTHAVTLRLIRATLEGTLPEYPREIARNGEIWEVDFRGRGRIHTLKSHFLGSAAERNSRA